MRRKKIHVFIDLDGTLLRSDGTVSGFTKLKVKEVLDRGINLWICSGRPVCFTRKIARNLDARVQTISFNGAMINDTIISTFSKEDIMKLMMLEEKEVIMFKSKNCIYSSVVPVPEQFSYRSESSFMVEAGLESIAYHEILKVLVLEPRNYEAMVNSLNSLKLNTNMSLYKNLGAEISPGNINKGSAIQRVKRDGDYIIGIGNDVNDISMFEVSDYSVAMSSSHESVLELASTITKTPDEDGVGLFLEKLIKIKGELL